MVLVENDGEKPWLHNGNGTLDHRSTHNLRDTKDALLITIEDESRAQSDSVSNQGSSGESPQPFDNNGLVDYFIAFSFSKLCGTFHVKICGKAIEIRS